MKKTLLIVASLALGTAAIAQDMPAGAPTDASQPTTAAPADAGAMPQTPDSSTPPAGGMSAPSGGMSAPDGAMAPPAGGQGAAMATPVDTSSYPKCGKGMTDKCVQSGGAGHASMHHGAKHHAVKHRHPK